MYSNFDTICPNCFSDKMAGGVCGACGYELKNGRKNVLALPQFSILKDNYIVGRIIGSGGFGITYLAYNLKQNKKCAIKEFVPLGIVAREGDTKTLEPISQEKERIFDHGKKRFFEEAQALYRCANIEEVVKPIDYFKENGTVYFVMEYLEGVTLKKYTISKGGKLPVATAKTVVEQAAKAMDRIHRETGMFHRDISPENIMLTLDAKVKIIDFGSAKNLFNKGENLSVVLKPGFAPPEQYSSSGKQGTFTDVYALAGTFYYVVSGETLPVAPERLAGEDYKKLKDMNLGVDEQISDAVDRALRLRASERTQTMEEFVLDMYGTSREKAMKSVNVQKPKVESVPYMIVQQGLMQGYRWNLPCDQDVCVGRSEKLSQIVIHDDEMQVSKVHFIIRYDSQKDAFYIEDYSTNGTYIQNFQLEKGKRYLLDKNSVIIVGEYLCLIKIGVDYEGQ